jgi:3-deoxy-D-manno-octulosonic-acid transferase
MLLRARAGAGREDASRLGERLGRAGPPRPEGRLVWLHGVSVGESLSLLPLAERLRDERPDVAVLVTSGTRASGEVLARRLPPSVIHQYAPLDVPGAVDAFLDHWRPALAVIVESELWPNLIFGAAARGAKLALVSARLSRGSFNAWARAPGAARAIFGAFDLVLARDAEAARQLRRLGARVDGVADMKLGAAPLPVDDRELDRLRASLRERPVMLAASTHPGEEAMVLDRFISAKGDRADPLLIIAPRHVERGSIVASLARDRGLASAQRSEQTDPAGLDAYVADTVGEFGLWYRLARLAFLGGSLTPGLGGHNPLEPARLGCPVVSGDKVDNWPIYRELARCGAVLLVDGADALDPAFRAALEAPAPLASMAETAREYVASRDAEAAAAITRVLALLDP